MAVGGPSDNNGVGATWIFMNTGTWSQQDKLVGTGYIGQSRQGFGVSLVNNVLAIGGFNNNDTGSIWLFTLSGGMWNQQSMITQSETNTFNLGESVSLSLSGTILSSGGNYLGNGSTFIFNNSNKIAVLTGTNGINQSIQGNAVSISYDGTYIVEGGVYVGYGAIWVFKFNGSIWIQQGIKISPTDSIKNSNFGSSTSISSKGSTLAVGGIGDNDYTGATWIYTNINDVWTQQAKLVGTDNIGICLQGYSVSLSADGNTLAVGGPYDNVNIGATWIFTSINGVWTQQAKLIGDNIGQSNQGGSVSLNSNGTLLAIGGLGDNDNMGATWIFTKINNIWVQQIKLIGTGNVGNSQQGYSVSLTADGNTLAIGGVANDGYKGAIWIFTKINNTWTQQTKLSSNVIGEGRSLSLSGNGNLLVSGSYGNTLIYG